MKTKIILVFLPLFTSYFSCLSQNNGKATRIEQARGLSLCACVEYQRKMIDSTYQSKDYSLSYFVQMSDLSLEEISAIVNYTNKNCIKYVGIPQEIDGNMLGYSCWCWCKSKELSRFIKKTLNNSSKPENPPAIDCLKKNVDNGR